MGALKSTLLSALLLIFAATAIGMAVNPFRGRSRIDLYRDYAPPKAAPVVPGAATRPAVPDGPPQPATEPDPSRASGTTPTAHVAHEFQELTYEEVVALHADPLTQIHLYVFLDARNDDAYRAGHIPGAIQCDYWRGDVPQVVDRAMAAEKVIVYCNGGACEDSLHVCRELLRYGVPQGNIYLFAGGWEQWARRSTKIEQVQP